MLKTTNLKFNDCEEILKANQITSGSIYAGKPYFGMTVNEPWDQRPMYELPSDAADSFSPKAMIYTSGDDVQIIERIHINHDTGTVYRYELIAAVGENETTVYDHEREPYDEALIDTIYQAEVDVNLYANPSMVVASGFASPITQYTEGQQSSTYFNTSMGYRQPLCITVTKNEYESGLIDVYLGVCNYEDDTPCLTLPSHIETIINSIYGLQNQVDEMKRSYINW